MTGYPGEEITKLFYKIDAPFHSIFIQGNKDRLSKNPKYRKLSMDIKNSLKEISQKTGGTFIVSGNTIEPALDTIKNKEDISYLLAFNPKTPGEMGKINVAVGNNMYRVYYHDNSGIDYFSQYLKKQKDSETPSIRVKDMDLKDKKFSMNITNFLRQKAQDGMIGKISVRIRIKKRQDNKIPFDQIKTLLPRSEIVHISIPFPWLKKGRYDISVDVKDLLTGKTGFNNLQTVVD